MPLKRKITESSAARKVRFNSEESVSDDESVSTVNESEEGSEGSDEVGATATCSTCHLSMNPQFLEDLKRGKAGEREDIFKKSFFDRLDKD